MSTTLVTEGLYEEVNGFHVQGSTRKAMKLEKTIRDRARLFGEDVGNGDLSSFVTNADDAVLAQVIRETPGVENASPVTWMIVRTLLEGVR